MHDRKNIPTATTSSSVIDPAQSSTQPTNGFSWTAALLQIFLNIHPITIIKPEAKAKSQAENSDKLIKWSVGESLFFTLIAGACYQSGKIPGGFALTIVGLFSSMRIGVAAHNANQAWKHYDKLRKLKPEYLLVQNENYLSFRKPS